jgi:ABC-type branched-subunit amino acid transport system ATPase component
MYRDSVEIDELKHPFQVDYIRMKTGTSGAGRFRGAPAPEMAVTPKENPIEFIWSCDGSETPPKGVRGGGDGIRAEYRIERADGTMQPLASIVVMQVGKGDRVAGWHTSGGGYGHPMDRDPALVLMDVLGATKRSNVRARSTALSSAVLPRMRHWPSTRRQPPHCGRRAWCEGQHGQGATPPQARRTGANMKAEPRLRLQSNAVSVSFEGLRAISGVSLILAKGEILGLIGPNGAGKTTLVNCLSGFQRPTDGRVTLGGRDTTGWPAASFRHAGVARTTQGGRLFRDMTVLQNVEVTGLGMGLSRRAADRRAVELLDWVGIAGLSDRLAGTLPYTDERRVAIARALIMAPDFLLLDEPAAGMSDHE